MKKDVGFRKLRDLNESLVKDIPGEIKGLKNLLDQILKKESNIGVKDIVQFMIQMQNELKDLKQITAGFMRQMKSGEFGIKLDTKESKRILELQDIETYIPEIDTSNLSAKIGVQKVKTDKLSIPEAPISVKANIKRGKNG